MATYISVKRLVTRESPRDIFREDFPQWPDLPIRGGWGYDTESAVVIDKNDPTVPQGIPFDGMEVEHMFADMRLWEELIVFRPQGERLAGIHKTIIDQSLISGDEKSGLMYDVLRFQVTALPETEWEALKAIWEGPNGIASPTFDREAHQRRHEAATKTFEANYWFEISSFYGQ